jgi:mono/diheme cytochrome c family protein
MCRSMTGTRVAVLSLGLAGAALTLSNRVSAQAADQATLDLGKKEEARSCVPCHSLRLIHSQRLARAAWVKELDKMAGWGSVVKDRDALLEYLVANYGNDKPVPVPDMTQNGK